MTEPNLAYPCIRCGLQLNSYSHVDGSSTTYHRYEPDLRVSFTVALPDITEDDEETDNSGIDMTRAEYICEDLDKPGYDKKIVKKATTRSVAKATAENIPKNIPTATFKEDRPYGGIKKKNVTEADKEQGIEPNLFGSKVNNNIHLPMFDIDYSAELIPSSTKGHFHLYLNRPITWYRYKKVLRAMWKAGLIEKGVYLGALHYKEVYLRKPGVKKHNWYRGADGNPEGV